MKYELTCRKQFPEHRSRSQALSDRKTLCTTTNGTEIARYYYTKHQTFTISQHVYINIYVYKFVSVNSL